MRVYSNELGSSTPVCHYPVLAIFPVSSVCSLVAYQQVAAANRRPLTSRCRWTAVPPALVPFVNVDSSVDLACGSVLEEGHVEILAHEDVQSFKHTARGADQNKHGSRGTSYFYLPSTKSRSALTRASL